MPGQIIGCARVSSDDQNLDHRVAAVRAALAGEPDRGFTDHARRASATRPALAAMLADVRDGDSVLVSSMDRLARSFVDLDQLVTRLSGAARVGVRFLKEGLTFQPTGQAAPLAVFQLQMMGAFAQLERTLIRDRQRGGIAAARDGVSIAAGRDV